MSAPGHCRHCSDICISTDSWHVREYEDGFAEYRSNCPACDEAERIAQLLDEEAATTGPERLSDHDARAQTWQAAANLARGRR